MSQNEAPTPTGPVNWDQAEAAALQYYSQNGIDRPEALRAVKDRFNVYRAQTNLTQKHADGVTELFLDRKRIAALTATSISDIGKLAGTSHVQSQQKAQDAATSIRQLAMATDIETTAITNKFYAGWVGPITFLGKFLNAAGLNTWGDKVIQFANDLAPPKIDQTAAEENMRDRQSKVRYDASTSSNLALSVLNKALLMTDPDIVGMGDVSVSKTQGQLEGIAEAALDTGTKDIPKAGASAAPTADGSSAVPDIAKMSAQIISRAKGNDVKIAPETTQAVLAEFLGADKDGNKKLTGKEIDSLRDSKAYDSLSFDQRKIIDNVVGIAPSLKDKALAVLPGYSLDLK